MSFLKTSHLPMRWMADLMIRLSAQTKRLRETTGVLLISPKDLHLLVKGILTVHTPRIC